MLRGSKRSGEVLTQTTVWLAGFFISDATGTAMPLTFCFVCTKTRTGCPTAKPFRAAP